MSEFDPRIRKPPSHASVPESIVSGMGALGFVTWSLAQFQIDDASSATSSADPVGPIYPYESSFDCEAAYKELGHHNVADPASLNRASEIVANCVAAGGGGFAGRLRQIAPWLKAHGPARHYPANARGLLRPQTYTRSKAAEHKRQPAPASNGGPTHANMADITSYVDSHLVDGELWAAIKFPEAGQIIQRINDWFLIGKLEGQKLAIRVFKQDGSKKVATAELDVELGMGYALNPREKFLPELDELVKTCAAYWQTVL